MILPLVVLLLAMVGPLSSLETPFQLANCTVQPLSLQYDLVSPNSKVCAPISIPWKVKFLTGGAPLFNASLPNVLCVYDPLTVYFNGSAGFSGTRASLTVCHVTDGTCVQVNLFGYPGIYALNSTVIAAGANLNQPLWQTFGIKNPTFTVCDSALGTPVNATAFDDPNPADCINSDSYPARNIQLQSPLSLPAGAYIIVLSSGSCNGSGVKSEPLTLVVTSSVTPMTSNTRVMPTTTAIAPTYVAVTTSATPSISNAPSNDALFIGLGVGLTIFVLLAVFVVMAVLIKRGHLCTWKVVHEAMQARIALSDLKGKDGGDPVHSKPISPAHGTADLEAQNIHTLQTESRNNNLVQYSEKLVETSNKRVVVISEEDNQWHHELANNLAQCHHSKPHFLAWTSNSRDLSRSVYQCLASEDCVQLYVVWKGPLEDKQSSDFHSFVCELETQHAVQKLGLVQLGAPTTVIRHCGHTSVALVTSDGADVRIRQEQQQQRSILEKIATSSSGTLETVQNIDIKVTSLTMESKQTVDAVQTLVLKEADHLQ
ncbi:hypothetical protein EMCRGX_G034539 [Ephydatia muelleri]